MTIDGGSIGCARECTVQLPEEGAISEVCYLDATAIVLLIYFQEHVRIYYDHKNASADNTKGFWLRNDSRHAVLVNDTVITRKKTIDINHGDIMLIGDNRLLFHIHKGSNIFNVNIFN